LLFLIYLHDFLDPNTFTSSISGNGVEFRDLPATSFGPRVQLFQATRANAKVFLLVHREGCEAETTQRLSPAQSTGSESPIRSSSSQFRDISKSIAAIPSTFPIRQHPLQFPHRTKLTYQHSSEIPSIRKISRDDTFGSFCLLNRLLLSNSHEVSDITRTKLCLSATPQQTNGLQ
jgi:hypothetical protein